MTAMHARSFWFIAVCLVAGLPDASAAQSVPDPNCLKSALADYWEANSTILQRLTLENTLLSPEDQVGLRRFKEQYCLRYAQCLYGAAPESVHVLPYRATFSACLQDRKLDPQIALPSK